MSLWSKLRRQAMVAFTLLGMGLGFSVNSPLPTWGQVQEKPQTTSTSQEQDTSKATFTIPATEMYDEPFGVPEPDELVLVESWQGGESFRSGMLWKIGRGQVFYFRPGDQQYAVFKEESVLKIIENASAWLGGLARATKL